MGAGRVRRGEVRVSEGSERVRLRARASARAWLVQAHIAQAGVCGANEHAVRRVRGARALTLGVRRLLVEARERVLLVADVADDLARVRVVANNAADVRHELRGRHVDGRRELHAVALKHERTRCLVRVDDREEAPAHGDLRAHEEVARPIGRAGAVRLERHVALRVVALVEAAVLLRGLEDVQCAAVGVRVGVGW